MRFERHQQYIEKVVGVKIRIADENLALLVIRNSTKNLRCQTSVLSKAVVELAVCVLSGIFFILVCFSSEKMANAKVNINTSVVRSFFEIDEKQEVSRCTLCNIQMAVS